MVLHYTTLHSTHSTSFHSIHIILLPVQLILLSTPLLHYTTLHYTTLHYTILPSFYIIPLNPHHSTTRSTSSTVHSAPALHYTTLHYTTLHYPHSTSFQSILIILLPVQLILLSTPLLHYTTLQFHSTPLKSFYSILLIPQLIPLNPHFSTTRSTYSTVHSTPLHCTALHCTALQYTPLILHRSTHSTAHSTQSTSFYYPFNLFYCPLHSTPLHPTPLNSFYIILLIPQLIPLNPLILHHSTHSTANSTRSTSFYYTFNFFYCLLHSCTTLH